MAVWTKMVSVPNPIIVDAAGTAGSGYVLKAYTPGTTTAISIEISTAGGSPQSTITANSEGKWEVSGNEVIPYIDRTCKWAIFATAAHATANTPAYMGFFDNVPQSSSGLTTETVYETVAIMVADSTLSVGDHVRTLGYLAIGDGGGNEYDVVAAATGTVDGGQYINLATHQALGLFPSGSVNTKQFGVATDNTGDQSTAVQAAYDFCDGDVAGTSGLLFLIAGDYRVTSGLVFDKRVRVLGAGNQITDIKCVGTFDGILTQYGQPISGFRIDGTGLTGRGMVLGSSTATGATSANIQLSDIVVNGCSSHGIEIISGDIGTLENVGCTNNGGDGIRVKGKSGEIATASCNAWSIKGGLDLRSNTGYGLRIMDNGGSASNNWMGQGLVIQENTAGGVRIETLAHQLSMYCEANQGSAEDLHLVTASQTNYITMLAASAIVNDEGSLNRVFNPFQGFDSIPAIRPSPMQVVGAGRDVSITAGYALNGSTGGIGGNAFLTGGTGYIGSNRGGHAIVNGGSGAGDPGKTLIQNTAYVTGGEVQIGNNTSLTYMYAPVLDAQAADDVAASGGGSFAASVTTQQSNIASTGADTVTLAAGGDGQVKTLYLESNAGGNVTVTPVVMHGGTSVVMTTAGQTLTFKYKETGWLLIANPFSLTVS